MPTPKEIFDQAFAPLQKPDPSTHDTAANDLRTLNLKEAERLIQGHINARNTQMPQIEFGYVENPDFNLNAGYDRPSHTGIIGIFTATVPLLYDTFYRIMAHPKAMGTTGDATVETARSLPGLWSNYETLLLSGRRTGESLAEMAPIDPGRKRYAELLAEHAVEFLVYHELAHITFGHAEYAAKNNLPFLMELYAKGSKAADNLKMQASKRAPTGMPPSPVLCAAFSILHITNKMFVLYSKGAIILSARLS